MMFVSALAPSRRQINCGANWGRNTRSSWARSPTAPHTGWAPYFGGQVSDPQRTFGSADSNAGPCPIADHRPDLGIDWRRRVSGHSIERPFPSMRGAGQLPQLCFEVIKVYWLGKKLCRAILRRLPPSLVITVSGHDHNCQVGEPLLDLAEQLQSVHAGHVEV